MISHKRLLASAVATIALAGAGAGPAVAAPWGEGVVDGQVQIEIWNALQ